MNRFLMSKLFLFLSAVIMIAAAAIIPLSGSIAHSFAASRSSHNIAYVNYDDSGFTESGIPSANIFSDSVVGGPSPTGSSADSVKYNGMTFTPLARASLSTSTLAPYDTLILFEVCDIATSLTSSQHAAINAYLAAGNKILLYDADRCATGEGGNADYSWFTFPFATSNPGPQGASGTLTIVENSTLTQGLASDPFTSDELGDANTATTSNPNWFAAAKTTNVLGNNGYFLAYARNKGLIIYDGADHWFSSGQTKSLTDLFLNELNQQYDPDNLPSSVPIAPSIRPLVIFLQGIDTKLDVLTPGQIIGLGTIPTTFKNVLGKHADYLQYSYFGSDKIGNPTPYDCGDTFNNTLAKDIKLLSDQIGKAVTAHHDTDIYLVGHSLGGVVAFGYLAFLEEQVMLKASLPLGVSLPSTAHLRAVVTLDSPIGGVTGGDNTLSKVLFTTPGSPSHCSKLRFLQNLESPSELVNVFHSTSLTASQDDTDPQGSKASLLVVHGPKVKFHAPLPSNQQLAEQARKDLGTSFLSIGNKNDFLWNPEPCLSIIKTTILGGLIGNPIIAAALQVIFRSLRIPDFRDTHWLEDEGNGNALYGAAFTAGHGCFLSTPVGLNHGKVLSDTDVQTGLTKFLKPMSVTSGPVGGNPFPPLGVEPIQGKERAS
jgi:pimeloyl-ACP methyl ester carboxylesterase